jgi:hypothetical protein
LLVPTTTKPAQTMEGQYGIQANLFLPTRSLGLAPTLVAHYHEV